MRTSLLILSAVAVSLASAGCGDDTSGSGSGGGGGGGATAASTSTTTVTAATGSTAATTATTGSQASTSGGGGEGGASPFCGDGTVDADEDCDGDVGGASCQDQGFDRGDLACTDRCAFDTSECGFNEVCDGELDEDQDLLVDCVDGDCGASPSCVSGEVCDGAFSDDDDDGLIECEDGECKAAGGCVPGAGATGDPCDVAGDCAANLEDPFCATAELGFPGGYCAEHCSLEADDCADGSVCAQAGAGPHGICIVSCIDNTDCRSEYVCASLGGALGCVPGTETCDNLVDDDNDGLEDCEDPSCIGDCAIGELNCINAIDDDQDGAIDCRDGECKAAGECEPGVGTAGTPCDENSDCAADEQDPMCLSEAGFGFPNGYCSQWCDTGGEDYAFGVCADEDVCAAVLGSAENSLCVQRCALGGNDCSPGYTCIDIQIGDNTGVCFLPGDGG